MAQPDVRNLSSREREVLYLIYELEPANVYQLQEGMKSEVSYNGVRRILDSLVAKKLVAAKAAGKRYLYTPVRSRAEEGTKLLKEIVKTFFDESAALGFANLLKSRDPRLQELEIENLKALLTDEDPPQSK